MTCSFYPVTSSNKIGTVLHYLVFFLDLFSRELTKENPCQYKMPVKCESKGLKANQVLTERRIENNIE